MHFIDAKLRLTVLDLNIKGGGLMVVITTMLRDWTKIVKTIEIPSPDHCYLMGWLENTSWDYFPFVVVWMRSPPSK